MIPVKREGPSVVALGGGHGLASTLRAARSYAGSITAVVSVADDGGSSGRLRQDMPLPAPGDLRRCLVALARQGSKWAEAYEYRFESGELAGHAFGNIVISGLAASSGDFLGALKEAERLVEAEGTVLPATIAPVRLVGRAAAGAVSGQAAITRATGIDFVELVPPNPEPPAQVLEAVEQAQQVILGPGSLYTSVLAALAVPKLCEAIANCSAKVVYVANLRQQIPETQGYDVAQHVEALVAHGVEPDVVLCDTSEIELGDLGVSYLDIPLAEVGFGVHNAARLASALEHLVG